MSEVRRYDVNPTADGYFDDPFIRSNSVGRFVLHSDYAALLARHNALVEAVAWYLECDACPLKNTTEAEKHGFAALWATRRAARAEVDKLLQKELI